MLTDQQILIHIERQAHQSANYKQLVRELRLRGQDRDQLTRRLESLVKRGKLVTGAAGRYAMPKTSRAQNLVSGKLSMHRDGYGFVLPDQNGWSRALHFQSAWIAVLIGLLYGIGGVFSGHFRRDLLPGKPDLSWRGFSAAIRHHLLFKRPTDGGDDSYNLPQRLTYLFVIFILFPLVIWTGLALSPGFISAFPATVNLLGGRQTARTLHFFISVALLVFLLVHVGMVFVFGFGRRMRAMITGHLRPAKERT